MSKTAKPARWWKAAGQGQIRCHLCPRACLIPDGARGFCQGRANTGGELFAITYGYPAALHVDPIEKKPLAAFMPGTQTFSIGLMGCNLDCSFCQNYHLSRGKPPLNPDASRYISPERIIAEAKSAQCASVAFTYNEPTVWAEYAMDIAKLAKNAGLATVLVSNGYITPGAADEFYPWIDAANIDMKGFSEDFYASMTDAKLAPVLAAIQKLYALGRHIELTNLVIPGQNDAPAMIEAYLDWVGKRLDLDVPLHFSAFYPTHKYFASDRTSPDTLRQIRDIAKARGFRRVFLGNI